MRLLNVHSRHLQTFYDSLPKYAILSHTWTQDPDYPEVSFEDLKRPDHVNMARYDKIEQTCRLANTEGLEWVWIDTCCIDKSSSAELSEAINSMFHWYRDSAVCFVHLEDVDKEDVLCDARVGRDSIFHRCRWFSRGWTLQELVAPGRLVFYDKMWQAIGDRSELSKHIQHRTSIAEDYLRDPRVDFRQARIGQRMAWACDRKTTRKEDIAYCLFGLFDVNMPLLYGEGDRAFRRLQEEIVKTSQDDTIFAWSEDDKIPFNTTGLDGDVLFHEQATTPILKGVGKQRAADFTSVSLCTGPPTVGSVTDFSIVS
ncbi:heterokaryon incompatibility protein-domain-containing protein [Podospora didyma]|uniref:Heterokaryon incompatibility protein-domain-containing protein n=1 Tax=Podospora didyma TaxID=330526 RepID=A0AAE0K756_9PEZI|nr:heterokaryon incompatibility protein-domain-containing protein [Podospora didyma]